MTAEYFSIVTTLGLVRIAPAIADGTAVKPRDVAIGDGGGYTPVAGQVALRREAFWAQITNLSVAPTSPNVMIAEGALPAAEGGWTAREIAP